MRPDRANYEIWLIDYLDGTLSQAQVDQLFSFLDANPDIREEFEELSQYNIIPDFSSFPLKAKIKKSASELSQTQFELLCIAAIENDLSEEQRDELEFILSENKEKSKIFGQIKNLRLTPPAIKYNRKSALRKLTITQKAIRLAVIGLSAAAGLTILISLFNRPALRSDDLRYVTAISSGADSPGIKKDNGNNAAGSISGEKKDAQNTKSEDLLASVRQTFPDEIYAISEKSVGSDSLPVTREHGISKIDFIKEVTLAEGENSRTLIAMNPPVVSVRSVPEESNLNKFIAKIFREKIYKSPTPETGSLKAYEIADAGINGLNRLFGLEMSLQKKRDEKGELKALRFNSRFIKFNAPVKRAQLNP
jgi:hypothetical protein